MSQALAEYVALSLSRFSAGAGAVIRQGVAYASEHFVILLVGLLVLVLGLMLASGSRR